MKAGRYCTSTFESDQKWDLEDQQLASKAFERLRHEITPKRSINVLKLIYSIDGAVDVVKPDRPFPRARDRVSLYLKNLVEDAIGAQIESLVPDGDSVGKCDICARKGWTFVPSGRVGAPNTIMCPQYRTGFQIEMSLGRWDDKLKAKGDERWCLCIWCATLLAGIDGHGYGDIEASAKAGTSGCASAIVVLLGISGVASVVGWRCCF